MSRIAAATLTALSFGLLAPLAGCDDPIEGFTPDVVVEAFECEGSAYGKSMDTASPEPTEVWAEVDGADIVMHLDNLDANCCPSPDADVNISGSDITVLFEDVTDNNPCDCTCITDFTVTIESVDQGSYTVDVQYNSSSIGTVDVEV